MSTFYIRPFAGSDSADGKDFTSAWRTWTGGPTAAKIAPGDTIRVEKSPDPTLVGNAQWTTGPVPATKNIASSVNLTPIRMVVSSHGYSTNDTVCVAGHTTNTSANGYWMIDVIDSSAFTLRGSRGVGTGGAAGTVRKSNCRSVVLDTAVTAKIVDFDSSNFIKYVGNDATCTWDLSGQKQGYANGRFFPGASSSNGKLVYAETDNTALDLSAYTQISFWAKSNTTIAAGLFNLDLCSDKTGQVTVNSVAIPAMVASAPWAPFCIDTSSALGSSIQSIAITKVSGTGTPSIWMDHIIACKAPASADSLSLASVITKNSDASGGGSEGYYCIKSIEGEGRVVVIDQVPASTVDVSYGYWGDTTNCPTYKRECFFETVPTAVGNNVLTLNEAGTTLARNKMEGGWGLDGTRSGCTLYDGRTGWGRNAFTVNYWDISRINLLRYETGLQFGGGGNFNSFTECNSVNHCAATSLNLYNGATVQVNNANNGGNGIAYNRCSNINATVLKINNNSSSGIAIYEAFGNTLNLGEVYNTPIGITIDSNTNDVINNCTTTSCTTVGLQVLKGQPRLYNCNFDSSSIAANLGFQIYSQKDGGVANKHVLRCDGGEVTRQDATSLTGTSWDFGIRSTRIQQYPLRLPVLRMAVTAPNKQITIQASMMKNHATNIGGQILVKGYQIGGVTTDQSAVLADNTNWQTLTLNFTPTEIGCFELESQGWYRAGAGNVYLDSSVSATQAP